MASLSGFTAAEVGFLVVKPFKKFPSLARGTNGGTKWECSLSDKGETSMGEDKKGGLFARLKSFRPIIKEIFCSAL